MITKVAKTRKASAGNTTGTPAHGRNVGGLLRYLYGPGRKDEHDNPHLVASWDGQEQAHEPQRYTRPDGTEYPSIARLAGELTDPVQAALGISLDDPHVYHLVLSNKAGADRDLTDPNHRGRWRDWAQWANVIQFISGPGRHGIVSATSDADDLPLEDHWLVALAHPADDEPMAEEVDDVSPPVDLTESGAAAPGISDDMVDELDLLEDDGVKGLVEAALVLGAPDFVAGEELGGIPVEAAWSDAKVGVLASDGEDPGTVGWDLRQADGWTPESLKAALEGQS